MMPTRAVLLTTEFPPDPGGIARLLGDWCQNSDRVHWRVVRLVRGRGTLCLLLDVVRAVVWCLGSRRRVIVAGHAYLSALAVLLRVLLRAPSVCIVYGRELIPWTRVQRMALFPLRCMDTVVAISRSTSALAVTAGVPPDRVTLKAPRLRSHLSGVARTSRCDRSALTLVCVSRMAEAYKNLEIVLRLAKALEPTGAVECVHMVGAGPRLQALVTKSESLGLGGTVRFHPSCSDAELGLLLSESHVALMPSGHFVAEGGLEGFGLVVHEYGAAGLPVLAGDAGGVPDAAVSPWTQLLDPWDLRMWVDAIMSLHVDEKRRSNLGKAAFSWAETSLIQEPNRQLEAVVIGNRY